MQHRTLAEYIRKSWQKTHPSSGVQFITVSTATGTNHSIVSAETILWSVPVAVDTVQKLYSWWWVYTTPETCRVNLAVQKLTAYSCICWLFHRIYYGARNHNLKIKLDHKRNRGQEFGLDLYASGKRHGRNIAISVKKFVLDKMRAISCMA